MRDFIIEENSVHTDFLDSRAKIQIFGGGFGNGKTSTACVKAIQLVEDYPGCNGLIARATFPKLNDTIRKEFKKWCPPKMIVSFPESKNSDNTAKFTNGSQINFRYIQQQGKGKDQSTSNLLSATYDWIIIDQMEDPEITYKDFLDLLGRLRGSTIYRGLDPTMPKSGPRWLIMTVNPTGNWFFKRIVQPIQIYKKTGRIVPDLLCRRNPTTHEPILDEDGKPDIFVEIHEASTYANARNLGTDFIEMLESSYTGQMKDRFLLGKWASYEGLVYPAFSEETNIITNQMMEEYLGNLSARFGYRPNFIEGYDYGLAAPSCYLLGFVDPLGIVHVIDGFYGPGMRTPDQGKQIKSIRAKYGVPNKEIYADPSIFRRISLTTGTVGPSIAQMFYDESKVEMIRGNNDIINGITKVTGYLEVQKNVVNPYTGETTSPMIFFSDHLDFVQDEFGSYMWKKEADGTSLDEPVDKNDHAMDTIKYMLSDRPEVGSLVLELHRIPAYMLWHEQETFNEPRYARYGS